MAKYVIRWRKHTVLALVLALFPFTWIGCEDNSEPDNEPARLDAVGTKYFPFVDGMYRLYAQVNHSTGDSSTFSHTISGPVEMYGQSAFLLKATGEYNSNWRTSTSSYYYASIDDTLYEYNDIWQKVSALIDLETAQIGDTLFYYHVDSTYIFDQVLSLSETVETPTGTFHNCLLYRDIWIHPGEFTDYGDSTLMHIWYASGVGMVKNEWGEYIPENLDAGEITSETTLIKFEIR